jgi:hypothetical protein
MSASSRLKTTYDVFNPSLGPEAYKADNLNSFILTAGRDEFDEFDKLLNAEKERLLNKAVSDAGINPHLYKDLSPAAVESNPAAKLHKANMNTIRMSASKTGAYRQALQKLRYDKVMQLYREGRLGRLDELSVSESISAGLTKEVNKDTVQRYFDDHTPEEFAKWLSQQQPVGFKTNALEQAGRLLKVKGLYSIKEKGLDRKVAIFNLIMRETGYATLGQGTVPVNDDLARYLRDKGITYVGDLSAMRADDLKNLARRFGLTTSGLKADLINNIAKAAGMGEMQSRSQIIHNVKSITELANTDRLAAREQASQLDPNELLQVSLEDMRLLAEKLALHREYPQTGARGGAPSRELIIRTLTGKATSKSKSDTLNSAVKANPEMCYATDPDIVESIARQMKIPTIGLTTGQICDKIYAYHLSRVSELILRRGGDIEKIAASPASDQPAQVKRLATTLKLGSSVNTLDDLIRLWLNDHYRARAGTLFPNRKGDVDAYLSSGTLPADPLALRDLGVIFSDVRRDMYSMDDAQRREAMGYLYDNFIARLQRGGSGAVSSFLANLPKFSFGTYTEGSPLRVVTSPRSNGSNRVYPPTGTNNGSPSSNRSYNGARSPTSNGSSSNRAYPPVASSSGATSPRSPTSNRAYPPTGANNGSPSSNRAFPPVASSSGAYNGTRPSSNRAYPASAIASGSNRSYSPPTRQSSASALPAASGSNRSYSPVNGTRPTSSPIRNGLSDLRDYTTNGRGLSFQPATDVVPEFDM